MIFVISVESVERVERKIYLIFFANKFDLIFVNLAAIR